MLLATDLDGTFLAGSDEDRLKLYQLISAHPDITLAFVTGRGLESVRPLLDDPAIPMPDYIICDVGCSIVEGSSQQPIQPIQDEIEQIWPGAHVVEAALSHIEGLQRQDQPQERRCSYFCNAEAISSEVESIVAELSCDLLYSADLYLDVLPPGINKGKTLTRLVEQLDHHPEQVLVAGDTLNDLSMYEHDFVGVCVGKSEPALLAATEKRTRVLHAKSEGCGGILEAFEYFGFLGPEAMAYESQSVDLA